MATQFKVNPGLSIFRKSGGVAGTDEVQISHNGTIGLLESKTGNIVLKTGSRTIALSSSSLSPDSGGVLSLGSLASYFSNVYSSTLISASTLALTSANGTGAAGSALTITSGSATDTDQNGGNITLTPGSANGTGTAGKVVVVGTLTATEIDTSLIKRGSAGSVSLFTDAGANNITIGGSTSTLIVAGNLQINGTTTTVNSTNLTVGDQNITVNSGGNNTSSAGAGINIEGDAAAIVGYFRVVAADISKLELKAPTGSILTISTTSASTLALSANLTVTANSVIDQNLATTANVSFNTVSSTGTGVNTLAGSVVVGAPAGGSQGVGTINATGIYINGTAVTGGISSLNDLSDVTLTSVVADNVLFYNGTQWVNAARGSASGVQAWDTDLDTIAGLAHTAGNVIRSNGTVWQSTTVSFNDLGDVVITSVANGDVVYYNGTNFVNAAPGATSGVQPYDADLTTIAGLAQGSNNFIVSNGTVWTNQAGATARNSLGLGTADTATFTGVNIGVAGATSNTYIMKNSTVDGTATELFLDGTATQLLIADGKTWAFEVIVAARRTDSGTEAARYKIEGALARFGIASTTTLIGDNETSVSEVSTSWDAVVSADTTTGALKITVTGEAAKDIKWVAFVRIVEASL